MSGYYCCDFCGHYFAAPEWPDQCENCKAHGSDLIPCGDEARAQEISEKVLARVRIGWAAPPERCPVCGGLNPGDVTHTRCAS